MRPLLFIASDRREIEPWVARWDHSQAAALPVHWAQVGAWRGRDVVAIANGVGVGRADAAVAAARSLAEDFEGIVSLGTSGALDASLAIVEVIVATAVTDGNTTWTTRDPGGPQARSGLVRTSPRIARTMAEKRNLRESGAIIVDMEAAGVAAAAQELAVPFYCVRVVSDLADETFFIDFEKFLMPDGGFNVARLVMYSLAHPVKGLPELLRLQRRTSAASEKLGEFLANCNF